MDFSGRGSEGHGNVCHETRFIIASPFTHRGCDGTAGQAGLPQCPHGRETQGQIYRRTAISPHTAPHERDRGQSPAACAAACFGCRSACFGWRSKAGSAVQAIVRGLLPQVVHALNKEWETMNPSRGTGHPPPGGVLQKVRPTADPNRVPDT